MFLLLPALALLVGVSFASASQITLSHTDTSNPDSFHAERRSLLNKYAGFAKRHFNSTGQHLDIVDLHYADKQKRASGKTPLRYNTYWTGSILVGSPPQAAPVVFDTGSSDLILDKSFYSPKNSLSANNLNTPFDFSYINLHVYGDIYSDHVAIGDVKADNVPIGHGREDFDGDLAGGKFGLSFSTAENSGFDVKQDPFIWAAKKQNPIQSSSFQFTLRRSGKATLNVGDVDHSELAGPISWADENTDKTFWRTSVELNGNKIENAIVDSGTNVITGPNDQVKAVLDQLDGVWVEQSPDGTYQGRYSCQNPPNLHFTVAGQTFKLSSDAINFGYAGDECFLAMGGTLGLNDWILGSPFMELGSVIFNYDTRRMGFAKAR